MWWRFGWTQNVQGSKKTPKKIASQFKGRLKEATGSKIENKLAIILSFSNKTRSFIYWCVSFKGRWMRDEIYKV